MAKYLLVIYLTYLISLSTCLPATSSNEIEEENPEENPEENQVVEEESSTEDIIDLSKLDRSIFNEPNNETGEILARWSPEQNVNPEELGTYLEGDMLIPSSKSRNGMIQQSLRWPGGIVPFEIRGSFNANEMALLERGINEYHARTCIRFRRRTNERDYISFVNGNSGCWSSVGRIGGRQEVNLQSPGCVTKIGTMLHECMHALGFLHEQNRYERDTYVTINWNNIQSSTRTNFDKASSSTTHAFGVPYDYGSVMHYSAHAFSTNGQPTIVAKQSISRNSMGQRDGFSAKDLQKINAMYKCTPSTSGHRPYGNSQSSQSANRPSSGNRPNNNNNRPFFNFLGNFMNGFGQFDEGEASRALAEQQQEVSEN